MIQEICFKHCIGQSPTHFTLYQPIIAFAAMVSREADEKIY